MTTIYDTLNAKGYEIVTCESYDDIRQLADLGGASRKGDWTPPRVARARPSRRGGNKLADLPQSSLAFIMRPSAVDALRDILEAHGEVLPLATNDGVELFVFNPRFVIDAIDKERSSYERVPETDIIWMRQYVFVESVIRGIDVFRVPFGPGRLYFSDRFVERVKAAKLKGTEFIKLWSSE